MSGNAGEDSAPGKGLRTFGRSPEALSLDAVAAIATGRARREGQPRLFVTRDLIGAETI